MVLLILYFVLEGVVFKVLVGQLLGCIHVFKLFHWREHSLVREHEGVFPFEVGSALIVAQIHAEVHGCTSASFLILPHVIELTTVTFVVYITSNHCPY